MLIEFNNFLVALVFLLPGFLTSRLIAARTPAMGKEVSIFQETFESLLRSVYIHLIITPIIYLVITSFTVNNNISIIDRILRDGLQAYYLAQPLQIVTLLFGWLVGAFLLAIFFGYKWDPLHILFSRLVKKTGTKSEDVFYQLREYVVGRRETGEKDFQWWIQARLKNGYTYQGEFYFVGYRHDGMSRELTLKNVTFFPYPAQIEGQTQSRPRHYDFVLIEVENCESLEIMFGQGIPSKNE
ncbi:MAG: hypothetical protein IH589_20815 [Anaerolineales bacterium]|nr:hypothetical protein [Anaerolineales bacterium]